MAKISFRKILTLSLGIFLIPMGFHSSVNANTCEQVNIDVADYAGEWQINGTTPAYSGNQTVCLEKNRLYGLRVALTSYGQINFKLDDEANVVSLKEVAAKGGLRSLKFNTRKIKIKAGKYKAPGKWELYKVTGTVQGDAEAILVPGLGYAIRIGLSPYGQFLFDVDAEGNVTSRNDDAAKGGKNKLRFKTGKIKVYPREYTGRWWIAHVTDFTEGKQKVTLVKGLGYGLRVGLTPYGQFLFDVGKDGKVTSRNGIAAKTKGKKIILNSHRISVTPDKDEQWRIADVIPLVTGPSEAVVVPGVSYSIKIGNQAGNFAVKTPCELIPSALSVATTNFTLACVSSEDVIKNY